MRVFIPMLLVAIMLLSCSQQTDTIEPIVPVPPAKPAPMSLAFASASSSQAQTRLTSDIVQNEASYRSIEDFRFFAFQKDGNTIQTISNFSVGQQEQEDKEKSRYYHFGYCVIPRGMNGCLAYAKAADVPQATPDKTAVYNGILNESFPDNLTSTDQIYFEPVSICGDETTIPAGPAGAMTLADALTEIANIQVNGAKWSTINSPDLRSLFSHFTNYGYDLPGSAASVREWINALKEAASGLTFGDGTTDKALCDKIIAMTTAYLSPEYASTLVGLTYPQDINLPDGAAALRWTDVEENGVLVKKFVPQLHTTTLDNINSVSRFVYPPALYYRVESDIWTSNEEVTFDQYRNRNSWAEGEGAVRELFEDGGTITSNTKTIAIQDPLQYAVARLELKVEVSNNISSDSQLKYDADGNTIAYTDGTNHYFRLTGVIVGGQRKVGYDFKPVNPSDVDARFVYDSQVPADFWLEKNSSKVMNTLVLQSYDGEDVNVILEFEYTGTTGFKCLNGYVYPGTRFYLVGEVKASDFTSGADAFNRDRIFTQDYTTTIQMTVKSLEKAYNVLPSILAKNLEIGVVTTPMWRAAQPSDPVIMD